MRRRLLPILLIPLLLFSLVAPFMYQGRASAAPSTPQSTPQAQQQTNLTCDGNLTSSITWILCPVIDLLTSMVNTVDGWITQDLVVCSNQIFGNTNAYQSCSTKNAKTTSDNYHRAWAAFRDLALGLMAIAGLVIVLAQALGWEVLDAYTIRKVLPRLLIAAIGITLSWPLMQFFVNLTNDLGFGIRQLIYAPFSGMHKDFGLGFNGPGGGIANFFFGSVTALGVIVAGIAMAGVIISLLFSAALAVIVALLVLTLRQIAIVLLILVAPIAIVAYILPSTQRTYHIWWDSFSKALLMFPIIAGIIAAGRVFSEISLQNSDILSQVIGFLAYFAPYFLIPATFRLAGSAVRQLGGFVNDRSRGAFDRLRQGRSKSINKKMENFGHKATTGEFKALGMVPGSRHVARAANRVGLGVGAGFAGRYGFFTRGQTAMGNIQQQAVYEAQKSPAMQSIAGKNDFNRVLAEGNGNQDAGRQGLIDHLMAGGDDGDFVDSFIRQAGGDGARGKAMAEAEARRRADFAVKSVKSIGFTEANAGAAFLNMAADGTAFRDVDDEMRLAALVSNGNPNNAFTFGARAASLSRQAGRPGLAPASTETGNLVFSHFDEMYPGRGLGPRQYTGGKSRQKLVREATQSGIGGENAYNLLGGAKSRDIEAHVENSLNILRRHMAPGPSPYTPEEAERAAAALVDMERNMNAGLGKLDNRRAAQKTFDKNREGVEALNEYLKMPSFATDPDTQQEVARVKTEKVSGPPEVLPSGMVGTRPSVEREVPVTNAEHINTLVARTWGDIPESEREKLLHPPTPPEGS